jgi:hypothetical protein
VNHTPTHVPAREMKSWAGNHRWVLAVLWTHSPPRAQPLGKAGFYVH